MIKSALVVPAHWSEKLRAASSSASRSWIPREESSPSALRVSKVASTGASTALVISPPTAAIPMPVFATPPKVCSICCSLLMEPPAAVVTRAIGSVRLSTIFIIRLNRNTDSRLMLRHSFPAAGLPTASLLSKSIHDAPLNDRHLYLLDVTRLCQKAQEVVNFHVVDVQPL